MPIAWMLTTLHSLKFGLNVHPVLLETTPVPVEANLVLAGVLVSLVVIYLASKIGGELCYRVNLPPVLGELLGGVVVGLSALHLLVFPEGSGGSESSLIMSFLANTTNLDPAAVEPTFAAISEVISTLAEIGVVILLFEVGLESDLKTLLKVGPQALVVAMVGVIVPFAAGTVGLMTLFGLSAIPAIFAGAALTATSIGITSKVLSELGRLNSKEGQIILGAAITDDVLGIIVLAVVASLAKTGDVDVGKVIYLIAIATAFLLGAILLGNFFNQAFVGIAKQLKTRGDLIIPAFIFAFMLAYIANAVQLEAILGSFAAGLVLDETDERKELQEKVFPIADLFVPIFFVVVGARTDLSVLNPTVPANQQGLVMAMFLIVVAILGKLVTGATVFGQGQINRLAIGVGMIPRGEVGLVFLNVGRANNILTPPLEAAIVMMVILTTFLAPPFLKLVFPERQTDQDVAPTQLDPQNLSGS
jgi:Kef-type K+ transport system membrane component KefB